MGNWTSRSILSKKRHRSRGSQTYSSNQNIDQQPSTKLHIDCHYDAMDKVFDQHLIFMHSDVDTKQSAANIHKNALNLAIKEHIDVAYLKIPNYQQAQRLIYTF